ncbi:MAG: ribosome silencing factor [Oceanospirillaceae bacterium]|nr:ribosome silencing factor [Oceanospirillaceae bacterium]
MQSKKVIEVAIAELENLKAKNIEVIDVRGKSSVTDYMVVCSGTSKRHVMSIAGNVEDELKLQSIVAIGSEGHKGGDWVIVDLSDVVIHVLTEEARELYDLEKLWRFDMQPGTIIEETK